MTTFELEHAAIRRETSRLLEDALYTYKGHYDAAAYWQRWHFRLGIPATALGVLAGVAVTQRTSWTPAVLAFASAGLTAGLTIVNPAQRAQRSRAAADAWHAQHDRLRRWTELDLPTLSVFEARKGLEEFAKEKQRLNSSAPAIPSAAQRRARRGIEVGEAQHLVDVQGAGGRG